MLYLYKKSLGVYIPIIWNLYNGTEGINVCKNCMNDECRLIHFGKSVKPWMFQISPLQTSMIFHKVTLTLSSSFYFYYYKSTVIYLY